MVMPRNIGAVDTMLGFPHRDMKEVYRFITRQTRDTQSKEEFDFPVEYMFKDVPDKALQDVDDLIAVTVREMDLWGIEKGLIGVGDPAGTGAEAMKRFPDRFIPSSGADPNEGMAGVNRLVREHETFGTRAVGVFPAGTFPQVAINDKKMYPIYAKCVELGIPNLLLCRDTGTATESILPACRTHRRGHVRLSGPDLRDAPRLRAMDRTGRETDAEVARSPLLNQRLRSQVLPEEHHRLRKQSWFRQDHLCRVFPDGTFPGTDHDRDAQCRIQGRGMAEIPSNERSESARPFVAPDPHDSVARNH